MVKILTVGEVLVEVMTTKIGQTFLEPGELVGPYPSGAPAIFIDQVAKMGVRCAIVARVGDDDFGRINCARLAADGVDISRIQQTPGYATGTAFVTYLANGERQFIFHFAHSAAGQLGPDDIDRDFVEQFDFLHIMGCSLSASASMRSAIEKTIAVAEECGTTISFDPNVRLELLSHSEVHGIFDRALAAADILLTGESELMALTGTSGVDLAVSALKNRPSMIVLRNGATGTTVLSGNEEHFVPSFIVTEVDPTGAGDCFDGAFLGSLARGESAVSAAEFANAAGALSVTKKGPMEGTVTLEAVKTFMATARRRTDKYM